MMHPIALAVIYRNLAKIKPRKPRKNVCAQAIAAELHRLLEAAPKPTYKAALQLIRDRAVEVPECRSAPAMVDRDGAEYIVWWDSDGKPDKRSVSAFKRYFYAD